MSISRRLLGQALAGSAAALLPAARFGAAWAQSGPARPIRIGTIYDLSGPLAAAGSVASSIGTQIAAELMNERGGVLGRHRIELVAGDAQSKPDVAINEAERLLGQNVDVLLGLFASAQAVPLAARTDAQKRILWVAIAISTAVFKGRNLQYTFRPNVHTDQQGETSPAFLAGIAQAKLGTPPDKLRVAVIYEDSPAGTGTSAGNEAGLKARGMQMVLKEGYPLTTPDLSSLVTKLKRARPDVVLHSGYNPDIKLFLRQARESGLRFRMLIGHGGGYADIDGLTQAFGRDVDGFCNVDSPGAQLLDGKTLAPGLGDLAARFLAAYRAKTGVTEVPPHASMGFNSTWVLLNDVLPVAATKYGSFEPDAIRQAALDVDLPVGGTVQGYGVKFAPPGHELAGQNLRASPVVMQYSAGKTFIAYPEALRTIDPIAPLPPGSPYALAG